MPVDEKRRRLAFQRLSRQLSKLADKPAPDSVHKFRTCGRRIEALLGEFTVGPNRNNKKLLKALARLRKKAGRVRDLDVQIGNLRNLKIPEESHRKAQVLQVLSDERLEREHKLLEMFDKKTVRGLQKRLRRAASEEIPQDLDPLQTALSQLARLSQDHAPLTEKTLHRYRVVGKRARYLAELAGKSPEADPIVQNLKHMQDVIGDWHDWLKLSARVEEIVGGVRDSVLIAALRNITRAKFRQAVDVLAETRSGLSGRKPSASAPRAKSSAAA